MKKIYLIFSVFLISIGCKSQKSLEAKSKGQVSPCYIQEESFENSALRKFLKTSTLRRDIIDQFLDSDSDYCILSIIDNNIMIAKYDGQKWEVENNEKKYAIINNDILKLVEDYSKINRVFKMACPKDYIVYDVNEFQAFWIKKKSELKFLYYSTAYEISEFNGADRKKVEAINEIISKLKT